ncbi:MAG: UDP-N-acetylmuramoyl-L-alanyl-D-glutamate--2,6-diaminopimelate ligase [Actinobacteria bacterium]|nr:UDP-N-acetylmuramoyl-L-alanyl-D-glutamate--2,6-diaminopimelate ligase [Actinomycetota bacterium]
MGFRPNTVNKKSLTEFNPKIFNKSVEITGVSINAQKVIPGDLFIAFAGAKTHGIKYLDQAIKNGAVAVLSDQEVQADIPLFTHPEPRVLVGPISAWLYSQPFNSLTALGITGTNGKTTTVNLINQMWQFNSIKSGLIGTLGVEVLDKKISLSRTTPEADELQAIVATMVEEKVTHLVMEVSSHAIDQGRIMGANYQVAGFSNLTQDHLDYHKTMEQYFLAKAKLFTKDYAQVAVINIDDQYGKRLAKQIDLPVMTVSRTKPAATWYLSDAQLTSSGYKIKINSSSGEIIQASFALLGDYNLDNLLMAVAMVSAAGMPADQISTAIEKLHSVPGRLETVDVGQSFRALVDYAHTPDAVERAITTVRKSTTGRLIGILGCGGDRDSSKRSLMGKALLAGSDFAIFTSDNPRSESAGEILQQMTAGLLINERGVIEPDRKLAIDCAVKNAKPEDVILLMGKGHESGQEVNGVITPFDDRSELAESIKRLAIK